MDGELVGDGGWAQRSVALLRETAADAWVLPEGWFMTSSSGGGDAAGPYRGLFVMVVNPQDPEGCVVSLSCAVREGMGASALIEDQSGNDVVAGEMTPGLHLDAAPGALSGWVKDCVRFVKRTAAQVNAFLLAMSPPRHYTLGLDAEGRPSVLEVLSARPDAAGKLRWRWREVWIEGVKHDLGPLMTGAETDGLTFDALTDQLKGLGVMEYCSVEGAHDGGLAVTVEYLMESRIEISIIDGATEGFS